MDCPKCLGILQKKKMENIEVDVCFVCEGIWFDAGELMEVIKADSKNFDSIDVGREEFDGVEAAVMREEFDKKEGQCPRCADGTMLQKGQHEEKENVTIDVCPKGHGVWLDGAEINALRKRGKVKKHKEREFFFGVLKYAFSKEGFRDFMQNRRGRKK